MTFLDRNLLVDGVRLAYRDRGEGEPVVFVHGTPSWSHEWRHVVPAVEAAGHRVVTYDLLGYGDSERPLDRDTSVAAQTDLLVGLLDELGLERPSLITHDIGGAIGQRIAVLHPRRARRLMLIDAVSYDSWPSETWREIIRNRLESYAAMSAEDFEEMLTRQLRMTVAGTMSDDDLRAYLAPHRTRAGAHLVLRAPGPALRLPVHRGAHRPARGHRDARAHRVGRARTGGSRSATPSASPRTSPAPSSSSCRTPATSSWRTSRSG